MIRIDNPEDLSNYYTETEVDTLLLGYLTLDQTTPQSVINGAPLFNVGLKSPKIYPSADSTTAVGIFKADGTTNVLNVDTTNGRVGIGTTSPRTNLDTDGVIRAVGGSYTAVPGAGSDTRTDVGMVIPAGMSYSGEWNGYIRNIIKWDSDDRDIDIGQAGTSLITNINLIAGSAGNIRIPRDNSKLYFGAGKDASIYYDGTNMLINPKEEGSGVLDVLGTLQTDGYNSSDGSAGMTDTRNFDDGDGNAHAVTIKNGLITGWTVTPS
jgi:hypothetical protein